MRIIDFHSHLGDILHQNGGALISKKGVNAASYDVISASEALSHSMPGTDISYRLLGSMVISAERVRNSRATLENFEQTSKDAGIYKSVCLPIPPYLTFNDLQKACKQSDTIIPFTGVNFSKPENWAEKLAIDVQNGAKGLKLHPNIQQVSLIDERTFQVIDAFREFKLPILFHCGVSSYYPGKDRAREEPQFGQIHYARDLVKRYPDVSFVAGHAGMFQVNDVIDLLGKFDNVWVDTSFQPVGKIRQLLNTFGEDKILFGSDWPFGSRMTALKIMTKVCRGNEALAEKIFHGNAEKLLGNL